MARHVIFLAVAAAVVASSAQAVSRAPTITQSAIDGVRLGFSKAQVRAQLGATGTTRDGTNDNPGQPEDWTALVFAKQRIAVYYESGKDKAVMVTTWNPAFRTSNGTGPCTAISRLKALYGATLKASKHNIDPAGHVYAYTAGKNLLFGADGAPPHPSTRVTAVGLFNGAGGDSALGYAGFVTDSEANC